MAKELTNTQKREYAETLFLRTDLTQKEIASKAGVSEQTITAWKEKYQWDAKRQSLLVTKSEIIRRYYNILDRLSRKIEADEKLGDAKEADKSIKYAAAIKALEIETNTGTMIETGMAFIQDVQSYDVEFAKQIAIAFDGFISKRLKRFN